MPQDVEEHNKKVLDTLEIGDLIEVPGRIYSHWAVFIGPFVKKDGSCVERIVHYTDVDRCGTAADSSSSNVFTNSENKNACVKIEDFWVIAKHSKVKKNNDKDRHMRPLLKEEIKKRAESKEGRVSYHLLKNNCEHFATWCRYDKEESQQADAAIFGGCLTVASVAGGGLYAADIVENDSSMQNEIQLRPAKPWGGVDLGTLVSAGSLLYAAFTDRRLTSNSAMWNNFAHIADATRIGIHESGKFCMDMGCRTGTCVFKASANGMNWPK